MPDVVFPNLGIEIGTVSREAVTLFGFPVYWYGIILGLGVLFGAALSFHVAKKTGQKLSQYYDFAFYAVIFSIIGARLYYVVFAWDSYKDNWLEIFNFRNGGLAIYGAVIAGVITAAVYTRIKKMNFFLLADTGVLGLLIGQSFGRWGNFINQEAFGDFTNGPLAMQLKLANVNGTTVTQLMRDNLIVREGLEYIQVHPTFFYESVWNFCLLVFLYFYTKRKKFDGEIFFLYLLGYGFARFFIEGLRTDQLKLFGTGLAASQLLSALLVFGALCAVVYKRIKLARAN